MINWLLKCLEIATKNTQPFSPNILCPKPKHQNRCHQEFLFGSIDFTLDRTFAKPQNLSTPTSTLVPRKPVTKFLVCCFQESKFLIFGVCLTKTWKMSQVTISVPSRFIYRAHREFKSCHILCKSVPPRFTSVSPSSTIML